LNTEIISAYSRQLYIELSILDKRLGNTHWQVPGPMPADDDGKPAYGFSGSCVTGDTTILLSDFSSISIQEAFELNKDLEVESCNFNIENRETKKIKKITKRRKFYYFCRNFLFRQELIVFSNYKTFVISTIDRIRV
jgi:hypothetical protein